MKVLIFGPSASGKTYVAHALQKLGINAFDAENIKGLSAWYNQEGKKVSEPTTVDEAAEKRLAFLWSRRSLARFLDQYTEVYVFGGSGNIARVFDLFDKVYFLKVDPELQKARLLSPERSTPHLDKNEQGEPIIWGSWFEELAMQQNISFVDASLTPEEILEAIRYA
jgi:hypothetical protein